ncbi:hypothetical protein HDU97_003310 [Phlyctochytrium planicorne]|nr:hypothetical protein HDU97_003310 [Phlyctochytrium planicorne]
MSCIHAFKRGQQNFSESGELKGCGIRQDESSAETSAFRFQDRLEVPMAMISKFSKNKVEAKLLFDIAFCARRLDKYMDGHMQLLDMENVKLALEQLRQKRAFVQECIDRDIKELFAFSKSCEIFVEVMKADEMNLVSNGFVTMAVEKRIMIEIHTALVSLINHYFKNNNPSEAAKAIIEFSWTKFFNNIHSRCRNALEKEAPSQGDFQLATPGCLGPQLTINPDFSNELKLKAAQEETQLKRKRSKTGTAAKPGVAFQSSQSSCDEDSVTKLMEARAKPRQKLTTAEIIAEMSIPLIDSNFLAMVSASASHISETPQSTKSSNKERSPMLMGTPPGYGMPSDLIDKELESSPPPLRKTLLRRLEIPSSAEKPPAAQNPLLSPSEFYKDFPILTSTQNPPETEQQGQPSSTRATQSSHDSRTTIGEDEIGNVTVDISSSSPIKGRHSPQAEKRKPILEDSQSPDNSFESLKQSKKIVRPNLASHKSAPSGDETGSSRLHGAKPVAGKENRLLDGNSETAPQPTRPSLARARTWNYPARSTNLQHHINESMSAGNSPPKDNGEPTFGIPKSITRRLQE